MKIASAKNSVRAKSAAAPKPRRRTAKSVAATINGPLAAGVAFSVAADVAFDEAATVVATEIISTLLPIAAERAHEVCDEAYVEQLLAASAALDSPSALETTKAESSPEPANELTEASTVVLAETSAELHAAREIVAPEPTAEASTNLVIADMIIENQTAVIENAADVAHDSSGVVLLPTQCLIRDAAQLKQQLLSHVNEAAAVSIDAHQIERIDSAALQVLLAFVRDRRSQQRAINWLGLTEVFVDSAQVLGLEQMLGLPVGGTAA